MAMLLPLEGFGHGVCTFGIERLLDKLASKLNMDPFDIRIKNAIAEGNKSPTQDIITLSNTGNITACLLKLKQVMNWNEGNIIKLIKELLSLKELPLFGKLPTHLLMPVLVLYLH